jgi:hypothetical protein
VHGLDTADAHQGRERSRAARQCRIAFVLADFRNPVNAWTSQARVHGLDTADAHQGRERSRAARQCRIAFVLADFRNPVLFGLILAEQPNNFTTWHSQEKSATSCAMRLVLPSTNTQKIRVAT